MGYLREYRLSDMYRFWRNGHRKQLITEASLEGKTALISGPTSGVGLATSCRLAQSGVNLILAARNGDKAEKLSRRLTGEYGVGVEVMLADYSDLDQVASLADLLAGRSGDLDLVINNAGIFLTEQRVTDRGIDEVFTVNHLAHFLLTYRLLPKLIAQGHGRIIYVNSEGHRFSRVYPDDLAFSRRRYTGFRSYGASKTAQLLTLWEFADRLEGSGVTINAVHPGAVLSNIGHGNGALYRWYAKNILSRVLKDPAVSADAIYYIAAAPELDRVSGRFFNLTHQERPAPHALDRNIGKIIWKISMDLAGLTEGE